MSKEVQAMPRHGRSRRRDMMALLLCNAWRRESRLSPIPWIGMGIEQRRSWQAVADLVIRWLSPFELLSDEQFLALLQKSEEADGDANDQEEEA